MSVKANSLKNNSSKNKLIQKEITSILGSIDDEIKISYDKDDYSVNVSVPITFSIPYMSNKNAQRVIYSKILESLISRDFNVKIHLSDDKTIFNITWLSDEEKKDIEYQNILLAKYTIKQ